jgi:hypothetical protein
LPDLADTATRSSHPAPGGVMGATPRMARTGVPCFPDGREHSPRWRDQPDRLPPPGAPAEQDRQPFAGSHPGRQSSHTCRTNRHPPDSQACGRVIEVTIGHGGLPGKEIRARSACRREKVPIAGAAALKLTASGANRTLGTERAPPASPGLRSGGRPPWRIEDAPSGRRAHERAEKAQCGRGAASRTVSKLLSRTAGEGGPSPQGWVRVCDGYFCSVTTTGFRASFTAAYQGRRLGCGASAIG